VGETVIITPYLDPKKIVALPVPTGYRWNFPNAALWSLVVGCGHQQDFAINATLGGDAVRDIMQDLSAQARLMCCPMCGYMMENKPKLVVLKGGKADKVTASE
jgi:hypothetical protein